MRLREILEHLIDCDSDRAFLAEALGGAVIDAVSHDETTGKNTPMSDILLAACLDLNGNFKGLVPHHDITEG